MIWLLFFMVAALSIIRVFAANRLVETSESLRVMDSEVAKIESENRLLAEDIRLKESITYIEDKASQLGFGRISHYAYLNSTVEVAFLR